MKSCQASRMFRPISVLLLVLCVLGLGVLHAQQQQPAGTMQGAAPILSSSSFSAFR